MIKAEDYALENMQGCDLQEIEQALIGFAKLWGEHIVKTISMKASANVVYDSFDGTYDAIINQKSILGAISLDDIK